MITKGHRSTLILIRDDFELGCTVPGLSRAPQFTLPDALASVSLLNEKMKIDTFSTQKWQL